MAGLYTYSNSSDTGIYLYMGECKLLPDLPGISKHLPSTLYL